MVKVYLHFADGRLQVEDVEEIPVRFHLTNDDGEIMHVFQLRDGDAPSPAEADYDEVK